MTIPRWHIFDRGVGKSIGSLDSPASWDALRAYQPSGSYGLGLSRDEWRTRAEADVNLWRRATQVLQFLQHLGARHVVSVGVGNGMLEYLLLKQDPSISLRCGDYAMESLGELRNRFLECNSIELMDIRYPNWAHADDVVLMNRVDMELGDEAWRHVFASLARQDIEHIVWVPCGLLSFAAVLVQARMAILAVLRGRKLVRAGYMRTQRSMVKLFEATYSLDTVSAAAAPGDGLPIWLLRRRSGAGHGEEVKC